ncbi:MAG: cyclase family protein [Candidatus Poribacteria bacterium]|nr:cyclase family protein [Candidatus Poribacteria bacterium]
MTKIVDLTMPIENHFRWTVDRQLRESFNRGSAFQVTWVGWAVHGFTHIDAPRHIDPNGQTTSDISLNQIVGRAAIVDLTSREPNSAITDAHIRSAGAHIDPGDIVLLKTCWDRVASPKRPEFWTTAPYMTRPACEWLLSRQIKAVGYDFPQDYPIRKLLEQEVSPISEFVTHDVLLRNGVIMIEYLCNLYELTAPYTQLYALPLKILDADGAPARVIAVQARA